MGIRSRNPRATLAGGAGSFAAIIWQAYASFTTASQLPSDASRGASMLADPPVWLPPLILIACLLVLVWSLWPREDEEAPVPAGPVTSQKTYGDGSHNIGQARDVHIHHAPAATQERKTDHWKIRSEPKRVSNTRIWEAIEWVAKSIGEIDHEHSFPEARRELRQAALDGRIEIFGRKEIAPPHMSAPEACVEVWSAISPGFWNDWRITEMAAGPLHDERPHTAAEEHIRTGLMSGRFWALRVDSTQLSREFPQPVASRKPTANLNLTELLVRVYKHQGKSPDTPVGRADFIRKIDFEIMDQITENNLHVWGRYGDRARELINPQSLKRGKLDHRKATFSIMGDAVRPMVFKDLTFNRSEVDQIWPKT